MAVQFLLNTVAAASNRLSATAGPVPARTYTYDATGSVTSGKGGMTYHDNGRLLAVQVSGGAGKYSYDGLGQRVHKAGFTTMFVYDESGRLLGEFSDLNIPVREYVYIGDMPVGVLTNNALVLDNPNTATAVVGTWATVSNNPANPTGYGGNFRTHAAGAGADSFTWTPTLATAGSYRIYARWAAGADRATNARYDITSAAGTSAVLVNQQARDGEWALLGTYSLTPGQAHKVTLTDNANGLVVADAVKFVPADAGTVYAIHTDHLNTPRLVVDQTQTAVWRWDQADPFGNNTANQDPDGNAIAFEFPLRFPGQYFDKESNFHYNYFRDYDPSIGRYLQSDPIGLQGGINTYAYVGGNPVSFADPEGLTAGTLTGAGIGLVVAGPPGAAVGAIVGTAVQAVVVVGGILVVMATPGDTQATESRSIPVPARPNCGCTCNCRADANQNDPKNTAAFAFGTATEHNCAEPSKVAKRNATRALGQQPKHIGCRCTGS